MARLSGLPLALAVFLVSSLGTAVQAAEDQRISPAPLPAVLGQGSAFREAVPPSSRRQLAACCKICRKGKACGNSCISRDKTCQQPPGCACDAR